MSEVNQLPVAINYFSHFFISCRVFGVVSEESDIINRPHEMDRAGFKYVLSNTNTRYQILSNTNTNTQTQILSNANTNANATI